MKHFYLFLAMAVLLSGAAKLDEATFTIGQKYYQQGLYTEAEKRFLEIVRKFPDSPKFRDSLYLLGRTYANMGNDKAALQYYKVLLNKAQSVAQKQGALLGIAKSWLQLGVYGKAAEFYSFYASEYPESEHTPGALYYAGIAREREGNIPAAVEKYRQIFELYPNSDFQGKAIEKVAVMDQNTPESLWKEPVRTAKAPLGIFPEGEDSAPVPGYAAPLPRAQSAQMTLQEAPPAAITQSAPSVVTQMIPSPQPIVTQLVQSPPVIITQMVQTPPLIVTQTIIAPMPQPPAAPLAPPPPALTQRELPKDIQAMISNRIVVFSNGQVVMNSNLPPEEAAKVAEYRRQWEAERRKEEQAKKLDAAAAALNQMVEVTDTKRSLLDAKAADLKEKQDNLRTYIYSGMSNANLLKPLPYKGVSNATVNFGAPTNAAANTTNAAQPPAPAPTPEPPAAPTAAEENYPDGAYPEDAYADYPEEGYLDEEAGLEANIDEGAADDYPAAE